MHNNKSDFLSKHSALSACKRKSSCSHTGYLIRFGTARVMKQGPRATTALRAREILMTSQRCHTCNRTNQYPGAKCPAVCFLQQPLMKTFYRVGQVNRPQRHPLHSGHTRLALTNRNVLASKFTRLDTRMI